MASLFCLFMKFNMIYLNVILTCWGWYSIVLFGLVSLQLRGVHKLNTSTDNLCTVPFFFFLQVGINLTSLLKSILLWRMFRIFQLIMCKFSSQKGKVFGAHEQEVIGEMIYNNGMGGMQVTWCLPNLDGTDNVNYTRREVVIQVHIVGLWEVCKAI